MSRRFVMMGAVRRYESLPGAPVSVTSVLSAVWPKPHLERWKQTEAVKMALANPTRSVAEIMKLRDADRSALDRGSAFHVMVERAIKHGPETIAPTPPRFRHWRAWWDDRRLDPLACEMTVVGHGYAGTLDLLAADSWTDESRRVIVDWKTCARLPNAPYDDHPVQLAAYAQAAYVAPNAPEGYLPLGHIDGGIVVYVSDTGVRAFDIVGPDWKLARQRWNAAWHFFLKLYPAYDPEER